MKALAQQIEEIPSIILSPYGDHAQTFWEKPDSAADYGTLWEHISVYNTYSQNIILIASCLYYCNDVVGVALCMTGQKGNTPLMQEVIDKLNTIPITHESAPYLEVLIATNGHFDFPELAEWAKTALRDYNKNR